MDDLLQICRRMRSSACFSNRETCACEMWISSATSICVRPSKNRRFRMRCSRGVRRSMASRSAICSSQCSSVFLVSPT